MVSFLKHPIEQVILSTFESKPALKFTYGELFQQTRQGCDGKLSRRDFQYALDSLRSAKLVLIEEDFPDRRRKRIQLAPPTPYDKLDYSAVLAWSVKEFLTGLFRKEPHLQPIYVSYLVSVSAEGLSSLTVERLRQDYAWWKYAWWYRLAEPEARGFLRFLKSTWVPVIREFSRHPDLEEEFRDVSIQANVKEITAAWSEGRPIDLGNIVLELRKTHAALAKKWLDAAS